MTKVFVYDFSEYFDAGLSDVFSNFEYYIDCESMTEEEEKLLKVQLTTDAFRSANRLYDNLYKDYKKYEGKQLSFNDVNGSYKDYGIK